MHISHGMHGCILKKSFPLMMIIDQIKNVFLVMFKMQIRSN